MEIVVNLKLHFNEKNWGQDLVNYENYQNVKKHRKKNRNVGVYQYYGL